MVRVRVDAQGRMVLPRALRDEVVSTPGEVLIRRSPDGLLLTAVGPGGSIDVDDDDGFPVLRLGRTVTNDEVLASIDRARAQR